MTGEATSRAALRPPVTRLYGRARGHRLRPRQAWLLDNVLPQLAFPPALAENPAAAFAAPPARLWLEVGFGGGEHAANLAAEHQDAGLIACEVFENGICSLLSRLALDAVVDPVLPGNLRLWPRDARPLLEALPDGALDKLFLMFPDPWPKQRHTRRRFVHPAQLPLLARVLRAGGEWRIATDDPTYQAWVAEVLADQDLFTAPAPVAERPQGWPATRYEAKAIRSGRQPLYWSITRK